MGGKTWMSSWGSCDCSVCSLSGLAAVGAVFAAPNAVEECVVIEESNLDAHPAASTVASSGVYTFEESAEEVQTGFCMKLGRAPLFDDVPFSRHFAEPLLLSASDFLAAARDSNGKVYVHCERGCSRSPAVVLCYLIRFEAMTLLDAAVFLKSRRVRISPNGGLVDALVRLEARLCSPSVDGTSVVESGKARVPSNREAVEEALRRPWLQDYRAGRIKLNKVDRIL